jgi:hypothetical protein
MMYGQKNIKKYLKMYGFEKGVHRGAVGWGTALQVGRSRVRFHMVSMGLTQPSTEMSIRNISWGWRRSARRADNLTTFMFRLSWNLGASTSWNPQGLSRPVMGLLYSLKKKRWQQANWWGYEVLECRSHYERIKFYQRSTNFAEIWEPHENSRRHKGDVCKVPY